MGTVRVYGGGGGGGGGKPQDASSPLLNGLLTGVVLIAAWVLLVYITHHKVGAAAWAVGGLMGVAVAKAARPPDKRSGMIAAVLTFGTILLAKLAMVVFVLRPIVLDELVRDPDATAAFYLAEMVDGRSFSPELQAEIDAHPAAARDTSFLGPGWELRDRMIEEAAERAQKAPRADRERLVRTHMTEVMDELGFGILLLGVFGIFDLVWLGLGVSTAWKLGQGIG